MSILRQTAHLLLLLLATHRIRPRDGFLVCLGFVIATATLTVILAIPSGIERIISATGQHDIVVVIAGNHPYETTSELSPEKINLISQLPQVARSANGRPLVAPQFVAMGKFTRADGQSGSVMLRGVTADIWELLNPHEIKMDVRIREGARQVLISEPLMQQFSALRQPEFRLRGREWQRIGVMEAGGSLAESELWTDFSALQAAYNRPGITSSLWLKLTSPEALEALRQAIQDDPRLSGLRARNLADFYQDRIGNIPQFTRAMAAGVSILLGLGACLVISGMLGIAMRNRRQQTATLRSLGFDRRALALASFLDVLVIGIVSALITAGLAAWWLDGVSFGAANFEQAVYAYFVVDTKVVVTVIAYALVLGCISSIFPLRQNLQGRLLTTLQE